MLLAPSEYLMHAVRAGQGWESFSFNAEADVVEGEQAVMILIAKEDIHRLRGLVKDGRFRALVYLAREVDLPPQ